jgi:hypothetical protein
MYRIPLDYDPFDRVVLREFRVGGRRKVSSEWWRITGAN